MHLELIKVPLRQVTTHLATILKCLSGSHFSYRYSSYLFDWGDIKFSYAYD